MPFIQRTGFTKNLALAVCAAVLGSAFQHGYHTGVVNAPQILIEEFINETYYNRNNEVMDDQSIKMIFSLAVAFFCVGGMIGALLTAVLAENFGRKKSLLVNNVFVVIACALMGFSKMAKSYEMIILGRFFIGLNSGLNAGLAPMYLNEISPAHLRGAIGTTYQLVITISILIAQVLGLPQCLGTEDKWPLLLAISIVPAAFQVIVLPLCPESPKYTLLSQGNEGASKKALMWLRGDNEIHEELEALNKEAESMNLVPKVTLKEMFRNPALRAPLLISVVIMLSQQLSGINAVIYYSTNIFLSANLTKQVALYATLGMGSINVLMTIISLGLVEKAGRKTLHMTGLVGMAIITLILTISLALQEKAPWLSYICILCVISFVVMFATGPGSIPWFLVSELFGQGARPIATSIAVCVNWSANFLVGLLFLPIEGALGHYTFLIFTGFLTLFSIYTYKCVPETKNKSPDEIATFFRQRSYQ